MAQIIKVNGNIVEIEPKNGKDFKLDELQKIVGGYIEIVYLLGGKIMVVDEEGKLKGYPMNPKATEVFQNSCKYFSLDVIVGDVLVCERRQVK